MENYEAFLLRIWWVDAEEQRLLLESAETGERFGFGSIIELVRWLSDNAPVQQPYVAALNAAREISEQTANQREDTQ